MKPGFPYNILLLRYTFNLTWNWKCSEHVSNGCNVTLTSMYNKKIKLIFFLKCIFFQLLLLHIVSFLIVPYSLYSIKYLFSYSKDYSNVIKRENLEFDCYFNVFLGRILFNIFRETSILKLNLFICYIFDREGWIILIYYYFFFQNCSKISLNQLSLDLFFSQKYPVI